MRNMYKPLWEHYTVGIDESVQPNTERKKNKGGQMWYKSSRKRRESL